MKTPYTLYLGDCLDHMEFMADNSVDSIVTDPPYGLGFMGKEWDHGVPGTQFWSEMLRVLKPGGHLLSFGGARTYHWLAANIETAGFEIRDQIMWMYGSGFPKSHNLEGDWQGWGTALKPAHEPICVARKPLIGTVAANVLAHGTGALNIDGCRVAVSLDADKSQLRTMNRSVREDGDGWGMSTISSDTPTVVRADGRWPANIIHDGSEEVVASFPDAKGQQGDLKGHAATRESPNGIFGAMAPAKDHAKRGDGGSAARFFYCAKTSKKDRDEGLENAPDKVLAMSNQAKAELKRGNSKEGSQLGVNDIKLRKNNHPTVKPTELMAYLCRLVTPPGGVVLDPFMGSGSTGKAAMQEGFKFVGIEREPDYMEIARARIEAALEL
jgi:site-specific DNA-methyltransferase (adenine-specific)